MRAYCHKDYIDNISKGNWYEYTEHENGQGEYYRLQKPPGGIAKASFPLFFYTEQEYRDKQIDIILKGI